MNISTVLFDLPLNRLAKRKVTAVSMQDQKEVILNSLVTVSLITNTSLTPSDLGCAGQKT